MAVAPKTRFEQALEAYEIDSQRWKQENIFKVERGKFHVSTVASGKSAEEIVANRRNPEEFSMQMLRIFRTGSLWDKHAKAIYPKKWANAKPGTFFDESFESVLVPGQKFRIVGSADLEDPDVSEVLEIKTCSWFRFHGIDKRTFQRSGVPLKERPSPEHVEQGNFYAWARGYKRVRVVYVSKDDAAIAEHVYDVDEGLAHAVLQLTDQVFALESKALALVPAA